jgi:hypothetical protein
MHLKILVVVLLVVLGLYVVTQSEDAPVKATVSLLGQLDSEKISKVILEHGEDKLELKLSGKTWVLPARHDYPADASKIRAFMLKLFDLSSSQHIPAGEEGLKKLGLVEEELKNGFSRVVFLDAEEKELGGLFLGKVRETKEETPPTMGMPVSSSGQFVREISGSGVFLISMPVNVVATVEHWIESNVLNVLRADILRIIAKFSDGAQDYRIDRVEENGALSLDGSFVLQDQKSGEKVKGSQITQLSGALENLRLSDVSKFDEAQQTKLDRTVDFFTKTGLVYSIKTQSKDDKVFARISVHFDEAFAAELKEYEARLKEKLKLEREKKESEKEAAEAEKQTEGAAEPVKKAEEEKPAEEPKVVLQLSSAKGAEKEQERFASWVFELPSYQGDKFRFSYPDLLESEEADKSAKESGKEQP